MSVLAHIAGAHAPVMDDYDFEDNRVFDRRGELKDSRSVLRLRTDRKGNRLTFKYVMGTGLKVSYAKTRITIENSVLEVKEDISGKVKFYLDENNRITYR